MQINFFYKDASLAATKICVFDLAKRLELHNGKIFAFNHNVSVSDITDDDINIIMSDIANDINFNEIPGTIILADPKPSDINQVRKAHSVVVSSTEQMLFYSKFNKNISVYPMFPIITKQPKLSHIDSKTLRLIYHGNLIHLNNSFTTLMPALAALSKKFPLELHLVYNINVLGKWNLHRRFLERHGVKILDHQWTPDCYKDIFTKDAIGLVPNFIPIRTKNYSLLTRLFNTRLFHISKRDYVMRFKSTSNSGRPFVFAISKVPFVVEPTLSTPEMFRNDVECLYALEADNWVTAITDIFENKELRKKLTKNAFKACQQINMDELAHLIFIEKNRPKLNLHSQSEIFHYDRKNKFISVNKNIILWACSKLKSKIREQK